MSIASEITRLQNAKTALATSIGNKGVSVPASTKLDGYAALVDSIQTGGGGQDDSQWIRPSNWPDLDSLDLTNETNCIYLTFDCRAAKAGYSRDIIGTRQFSPHQWQRGSIVNGIFVPVYTYTTYTNTPFWEYLPTDEGDFVVYKAINTDGINLVFGTGNLSSGESIGHYNYPCVEILAKGASFSSMCFRMVKHIKLINCTSKSENNVLFRYTNALERLDIVGSFTTSGSNGTTIFGECGADRLDLSLCDFSSFTQINNMFQSTYATKELILPVWDMKNITNLSHTFDGCNANYIDMRNKNLKAVTNLSYAFSVCTKLIELDLRGNDLSLVTSNSNMAVGCGSLKVVHIPETLTILQATALADNKACEEYHFYGTTPPTMANTNVFRSIPSGCKIYVPSSAVNTYKTASNWSTYASYIYAEP